MRITELLPSLPPTEANRVLQSIRSRLPALYPYAPGARTAFIKHAVACVAELRPTDRIEADLAVDIVLARAYCGQMLRLAADHSHDDRKLTRQCRREVSRMARLVAMQALREHQAGHPQRPPSQWRWLTSLFRIDRPVATSDALLSPATPRRPG